MKKITLWIGLILCFGLICLYLNQLSNLQQTAKAQLNNLESQGEPVNLKDLDSLSQSGTDNNSGEYRALINSAESLISAEPFNSACGISFSVLAEMPDSFWDEIDNQLSPYDTFFNQITNIQSENHERLTSTYTDSKETSELLRKLKALSTLSLFEAYMSARKGDTKTAVNRIAQAYKASEAVENCPRFNFFLTRSSIICRASEGLDAALKQGNFSENELREIERLLSDYRFDNSAATILRGERAVQLESLLEDTNCEPKASIHYCDVEIISKEVMSAFLKNPYQCRTIIEYINASQAMIRDSHLNYKEFAEKHPNNERSQDPVVKKYEQMCFDTIYERDKAAADIASSRISIMLRIYKMQFGGYPNALSLLDEKLGWQTPQDPFAGKPFSYISDGVSFLLYSTYSNISKTG